MGINSYITETVFMRGVIFFLEHMETRHIFTLTVYNVTVTQELKAYSFLCCETLDLATSHYRAAISHSF